ncbi:MAG: alcohol dehydrogenase catalytic domain-containing protein [Chloroflexota bacterium]
MSALVYEGPQQMPLCRVDLPTLKAGEVLIKVAYSGICGSELSGYLGKNSLRKPPLIMGHEFSGHIEQIDQQAHLQFPDLVVGQVVTANPLITCGQCLYCLSGRQQLCQQRKLISAALPGSNAEFVAMPAASVLPLPTDLPLILGALAEPVACAVHTAALLAPRPHESALIVGAGPIGLFMIQALQDWGVKTIYCADLNVDRLAMAEALGAISVDLSDGRFTDRVEIAVDAVGATATRQACSAATRAGGRVAWVGLHEAESLLPINDLIRREVICYGAFAYTALDFRYALAALAQKRFWLNESWTRVEPLQNGAACFQELIDGSNAAKIWLTPSQP